MHCPYCGSEIEEGTQICPSCGADLVQEAPDEEKAATIVCPYCGSRVDASLLFCPHCGSPIHTDADPTRTENTRTESMFETGEDTSGAKTNPYPPDIDPSWPVKSKWTACLLAFFLGGFGAHEFYLGHPKKAVIYILFLFTGFPMIIGILKGCQYILESDEEFMRSNKVRVLPRDQK